MPKRNHPLRDMCEDIANGTIICVRETWSYILFLCELSGMTLEALRNPRKIKYRTVSYYMDSCGSDAMPIIALLGTLIGVILSFQAIVQLNRFGVQSFVVNLVGTVITNELAPLVTAIVLAGRSGSAFAAELGTMKSNEELDAMVTMGLDTGRFLVFPKFLAMVLVLPGLTIIADICGIIGGMLVVCTQLNMSMAEYYNATINVVRPIDLSQGLIKSLIFGVIVASIGCLKGLNAQRDAQGVGRSATSAVVTAIFLIVVADALLTVAFAALENLVI